MTIIESMISQVEHQNVTVNETAGSFRTIEDNSDRVQSQSDALSGIVKELESANAGIMDSIQTISAISEEVAAHTNNTPVSYTHLVNFGMFLSGVLNFIIMAFVVFLIVKVMNRLFHGKEEPAAPTEKTCPLDVYKRQV